MQPDDRSCRRLAGALLRQLNSITGQILPEDATHEDWLRFAVSEPGSPFPPPVVEYRQWVSLYLRVILGKASALPADWMKKTPAELARELVAACQRTRTRTPT